VVDLGRTGKRALVAGAGQGIGRATALLLGEAGDLRGQRRDGIDHRFGGRRALAHLGDGEECDGRAQRATDDDAEEDRHAIDPNDRV